MPRVPRLLRRILLVCAILGLLAIIAAGILLASLNSRLPDVETLRTTELQEPLYVYSSDGQLMGLFGEMRRYPVDIAQVPKLVKDAFLAAEDARFYEHEGVDYKGVARALWLIAKTGSKEGVPGGSTITQQVARQFFLSTEVSYTRKLKEMLLALKMERHLGKDEIFQLYLNKSFFGNRAYGIAAAAEFYYGKTLEQLTLDEAAALAGVPKFPSTGNPLDNPQRNRERRDHYILPRMAELGMVSQAQANAAMAVPMHAAAHEREIEVHAPYIAEMVRLEMVSRYGEKAVEKGYHVTTTIDPATQAQADAAVRNGLRLYDHRHGWRKPQRIEVPADADVQAIAREVRKFPIQGDLRPAIVARTEGASAIVVMRDGSEATLPGGSAGWTGRNPGSLLARGDLVHVRRKPGGAEDAPPSWLLEQIPRAQGALVSLDSNTGRLMALVGGYAFAGNKFNRATQAERQPGSSFKPFVYAAAFERGFNPGSVVLDAPVVFRERNGRTWRPQNDGGGFSGPMRLREALVRSKNLVSVRLLDAIGVQYARRYISHFGFNEAKLPPNLSMSLGTAQLTPMAMARGFAAFNNGGFLVTPWFIEEVRDRDGKVIFKENPATACPQCMVNPASAAGAQPAAPAAKVDGFDLGPAPAPASKPDTANGEAGDTAKPRAVDPDMLVAPRAIDPRVAWQLQSMMRDVVKRGTGTAAKVLGRADVGGKTGSTNDHMDAWFAGFGGPYATVVWVGRDDNKPLGWGEYGGKAALPVWIDYMRSALKDVPDVVPDPPDGMIKVSIGPGGRMRAGEGGITEWVKVEDTERMESYDDYGPEQSAQPTEEAFDIF